MINRDEMHVHIVVGPNVSGCRALLRMLSIRYGFSWEIDLLLSLLTLRPVVTLTGFDEEGKLERVVRIAEAHRTPGFVTTVYRCGP